MPRRLLVYVANVEHPSGSLSVSDIVPLVDALASLGQVDNLDVLLHTGGGDPDVAEKFVAMVVGLIMIAMVTTFIVRTSGVIITAVSVIAMVVGTAGVMNSSSVVSGFTVTIRGGSTTATRTLTSDLMDCGTLTATTIQVCTSKSSSIKV
jgi:hypothetical protein